MAYSERELLARIVQCEAGRRGRQRNESGCNSDNEQSKCIKWRILKDIARRKYTKHNISTSPFPL